MRLFLLAALLLSFLFGPADAQQQIALVIGNSAYVGSPRVANAVHNAGAVTSALRGLGFDVTEMVDASRGEMHAAVRSFRERLARGDDTVGLFYYSGYAVQVEGSNFLLPADFSFTPKMASTAHLTLSGVPLGEVLSQLSGAGALKIVLLDPIEPPADPTELSPGLAAITPEESTIVMASSQPGSPASDGPDAGNVFTKQLVRRLEGPGAGIEALLAAVRDDVASQTGSRQIPELVIASAGVIDFAASLPAMPSNPDVALPETASSPDPERPAGPDLDAPSGGGGGLTDGASATGGSPFDDPDELAIPLDLPGLDSGGGFGDPGASGGDGYEEPVPTGSDDAVAVAPEPTAEPPGGPPTEEDAAPPPIVVAQPQPVPPPSPTTTAEPTGEPPTVEIVRHPTLDAPEEVVAGDAFTVSVALTEDQVTPDVTVRAGPGSTVTPENALEFSLPANSEDWPVDIDLLAAGFDLADGGAWSRRVMLFKVGDSDFARFTLKARSIRDGSRPRQLIARLYHEGRFLGSVARPLTVFRNQSAMGGGPAPDQSAAAAEAATPSAFTAFEVAAAAPALTTDIRLGDEAGDVPDLDATIVYSDPEEPGDGLIIIHSPHIGAPVSAAFTTPQGMNKWLDSEYLRLVQLGLKVRGASSLQSPDQPAGKAFVTKAAEGFGSDLYRNYVPDAFKQVFWSLKARAKLHSIQITSNSPVLPWELVRPEAADGTPDGFLGINYRLARWAPRSNAGQVDRPLDRLAFTGVATVAPAYDNNLELPFQKVEVDALSKLAGFRLVDGDFISFEKMVGEVSTGFIHFSGHGQVSDPGTGAPVFAIQLLDQALDPTTWRALTFAPHDKGNPFFFFNACDTGQARSLGGFVQGWGPAILASGASGFIGGMWPLTDRTAASFSTSFYGGISSHLKDGPVYLAEVLQGVRRQFYETGDPTYLAYTFYGNANLQIFRE